MTQSSVQALISSLIFVICIVTYVTSFHTISSFSSSIHRQSLKLSMKVADLRFDALLFDCDGVIAETERDAHRISFNEAFKSKGLTNQWDVEQYGKLLKIGGGKERMTAYFNEIGWPQDISGGTVDKKQFVQDLHTLKTGKFQEIVESGILPLRPGVMRLLDDALSNGIKVGVCSTSNEAAVSTIVKKLLGIDRFNQMKIYAGDIVSNKKPSPDIYNLAAKELGIVDKSKCWVIEDSEIGLKAAKAAGMRCCVTKSIYTVDEDFTGSDICINDLDRGLDGPITVSYLNYKCSTNAYKTKLSVNNAETFGATPDIAGMFTKIANGKSGLPFGM